MTEHLYPPKPEFGPLVGDAARMAVFGHFDYKVAADGNSIHILGDWVEKNIRTITVPELKGVKGAARDGVVAFHRKAADAIRFLFEEWEQEGLLCHLLTWDGSFCPRRIRGGKSLSNHAFGTAFDINAAWNPLGAEPALLKGTVLPLVEIANKHGFFWGGHYTHRKDGMHFEYSLTG